MSDEKPIRVKVQEMPGYVRDVPIFERKCETCFATFQGPKRQKYCRPACRVAAWKLRQGEAGRELQRKYQRKADAKRAGKRQQPPSGGTNE